MKTIKASALFFITLLFSAQSLALTKDFSQKAKIDADNQYIDIGKSVAVYKGNVKVRQGSIEINADRLEIYNHGNKGSEIMVLTGNPAIFSQTVDDGTLISANAKEVRFERSNNMIKLNRDAQLMWGKNSVNGETITYDMIRKLLNADGSSNQKEQVTTILQPSEKEQ